MKIGARLSVGALIVVSLIWVINLLALNTYTKIHQEFKIAETDIIPGAIAVADMINEAQGMRGWTYVYIL